MEAYNREAFWKRRDKWRTIGSSIEGLDSLRAVYEQEDDNVSIIFQHNTPKGFDSALVPLSREDFEGLNDAAIKQFLVTEVTKWFEAVAKTYFEPELDEAPDEDD